MNKEKIYIYLVSFIVLITSSCADLDEVDPSNFSAGTFPSASNPDTYRALSYRPLVTFRSFVDSQHGWMLVESGTDEVVVPIRGGGWNDGGKWRQMHFHDWDEEHAAVGVAWSDSYRGIVECNTIIEFVEEAEPFDGQAEIVAQTKAMRALYYSILVDLFGNVPLITSSDRSQISPPNNTRKEVFDFVEMELLGIIDDLPTAVDASTYGFPTKWMAHTLLAKIYLNAEVYTGTERWSDCIAQCNEVLAGPHGFNTWISSEADDWPDLINPFMSMFTADNGPQVNSIIFAMPNDANNGTRQNFIRRFMYGEVQQQFQVPGSAWNGHTTQLEFFQKFDDPNDQRNNMWLSGPQVDINGDALLNGAGEQIVVDPDLFAGGDFNVGGSTGFIRKGARSIKYFPDRNSVGSLWSSNDYIWFRYADIVLMKGEAEARQANNPDLALGAINTVRTERGAAPLTSPITMDDLLDERGREFAFEHWRRQDLIRFDKWEDSWGLNPGGHDPALRLFPIPQGQLNINPNLVQNPGY